MAKHFSKIALSFNMYDIRINCRLFFQLTIHNLSNWKPYSRAALDAVSKFACLRNKDPPKHSEWPDDY